MNGTSLCIFRSRTGTYFVRAAATAASLIIVFTLVFLAGPTAPAQTFTVIHTFTGQGDGDDPPAGLTIDAAGTLYGTTPTGGFGSGAVFKLKHSGTGWLFTPIYNFQGGGDGAFPQNRVAISRDGTLYSTAFSGLGLVFHLRPPLTAPKTALALWSETVIHNFTGGDGADPQGDLTFDQAGNIYGTNVNGGLGNCQGGCGAVYELTPGVGGWTATVLYSPQNDADGTQPSGGVVFGTSGDLYGVLQSGRPNNWGAIYQLSPSGSGWTKQLIHAFNQSDGANPRGGLIIDSAGNLYGTTPRFGSGGGGTVFELTPSRGGWVFKTLYSFSGPDDGGPWDKLVLDAAEDLYGTTYQDGAQGVGAVFKLTPSGGT